MNEWIERIAEAAAAAGRETLTWNAGDGRLLVLPHAARLIGCALEGVEGNHFWHHPDVEDPKKFGPMLEAGSCLIGGDRCWISPEAAHHWHDHEKARVDPMGTYRFEPQIDPGNYRAIESEPGHLRLEADMSLLDHRANDRIDLHVERQFIVEPSRAHGLPDALEAVSFSVHNTLTVTGGDDGAVAGTWDLLMVPSGGTLVCATIGGPCKPRCYFDPFADQQVTTEGSALYFRIDGKHRAKLGIRPEQTTGRVGYYRPRPEGRSSLVVRCFASLPGAPYVDLPLSCPIDQRFGGDCFQAYNDNGSYGDFGELEYHDAGVVAGRPPERRTAASITHVLAGPDAAIRRAGDVLLGISLVP